MLQRPNWSQRQTQPSREKNRVASGQRPPSGVTQAERVSTAKKHCFNANDPIQALKRPRASFDIGSHQVINNLNDRQGGRRNSKMNGHMTNHMQRETNSRLFKTTKLQKNKENLDLFHVQTVRKNIEESQETQKTLSNCQETNVGISADITQTKSVMQETSVAKHEGDTEPEDELPDADQGTIDAYLPSSEELVSDILHLQQPVDQLFDRHQMSAAREVRGPRTVASSVQPKLLVARMDGGETSRVDDLDMSHVSLLRQQQRFGLALPAIMSAQQTMSGPQMQIGSISSVQQNNTYSQHVSGHSSAILTPTTNQIKDGAFHLQAPVNYYQLEDNAEDMPPPRQRSEDVMDTLDQVEPIRPTTAWLNVPRDSSDDVRKSNSQLPNYFLEKTDDASEDGEEARRQSYKVSILEEHKMQAAISDSSSKTTEHKRQAKSVVKKLQVRGSSLDQQNRELLEDVVGQLQPFWPSAKASQKDLSESQELRQEQVRAHFLLRSVLQDHRLDTRIQRSESADSRGIRRRSNSIPGLSVKHEIEMSTGAQQALLGDLGSPIDIPQLLSPKNEVMMRRKSVSSTIGKRKLIKNDEGLQTNGKSKDYVKMNKSAVLEAAKDRYQQRQQDRLQQASANKASVRKPVRPRSGNVPRSGHKTAIKQPTCDSLEGTLEKARGAVRRKKSTTVMQPTASFINRMRVDTTLNETVPVDVKSAKSAGKSDQKMRRRKVERRASSLSASACPKRPQMAEYAKIVEITEFKDMEAPLLEQIQLQPQVNVLEQSENNFTMQEASSCKFANNELTSSMKNITMVNPAIQPCIMKINVQSDNKSIDSRNMGIRTPSRDSRNQNITVYDRSRESASKRKSGWQVETNFGRSGMPIVSNPGIEVFRQILESFAADQVHLTSARGSAESSEPFILHPQRCERFPSRYPSSCKSSASPHRDAFNQQNQKMKPAATKQRPRSTRNQAVKIMQQAVSTTGKSSSHVSDNAAPNPQLESFYAEMQRSIHERNQEHLRKRQLLIQMSDHVESSAPHEQKLNMDSQSVESPRSTNRGFSNERESTSIHRQSKNRRQQLQPEILPSADSLAASASFVQPSRGRPLSSLEIIDEVGEPAHLLSPTEMAAKNAKLQQSQKASKSPSHRKLQMMGSAAQSDKSSTREPRILFQLRSKSLKMMKKSKAQAGKTLKSKSMKRCRSQQQISRRRPAADYTSQVQPTSGCRLSSDRVLRLDAYCSASDRLSHCRSSNRLASRKDSKVSKKGREKEAKSAKSSCYGDRSRPRSSRSQSCAIGKHRGSKVSTSRSTLRDSRRDTHYLNQQALTQPASGCLPTGTGDLPQMQMMEPVVLAQFDSARDEQNPAIALKLQPSTDRGQPAIKLHKNVDVNTASEHSILQNQAPINMVGNANKSRSRQAKQAVNAKLTQQTVSELHVKRSKYTQSDVASTLQRATNGTDRLGSFVLSSASESRVSENTLQLIERSNVIRKKRLEQVRMAARRPPAPASMGSTYKDVLAKRAVKSAVGGLRVPTPKAARATEPADQFFEPDSGVSKHHFRHASKQQ